MRTRQGREDTKKGERWLERERAGKRAAVPSWKEVNRSGIKPVNEISKLKMRQNPSYIMKYWVV